MNSSFKCFLYNELGSVKRARHKEREAQGKCNSLPTPTPLGNFFYKKFLFFILAALILLAL